jgi:molybdopterin/thiamine biosynthesis adenylyltransferase
LNLDAVRRYGRQIALPEIGVEGQERILGAEVALVGTGIALETATRYLAGAGVGRFRVLGADTPLPSSGDEWVESLRGATLVLRAGFDDDPMLRAAVRLGLPVVVMRAGTGGLDVISFRHHGPCPHASLDVPVRPAGALPDEDGALAVVAGTVAATEALWRIASPVGGPRARHLRLTPVGEPLAQELPWAPECFLCGGQGREAVPS